MRSYAEQLALAERHVRDGRAVVERQRQLVRRHIESGTDARESEKLLLQFECSQTIFEEDLARLIAEQPR